MRSTIDLDTLAAYVDGELGESQCRSVERGLAEDEAARRTVDDMRRTSGLLRGAFNEPLRASIPERLLAPFEIVRNEAPRIRRGRRSAGWSCGARSSTSSPFELPSCHSALEVSQTNSASSTSQIEHANERILPLGLRRSQGISACMKLFLTARDGIIAWCVWINEGAERHSGLFGTKMVQTRLQASCTAGP